MEKSNDEGSKESTKKKEKQLMHDSSVQYIDKEPDAPGFEAVKRSATAEEINLSREVLAAPMTDSQEEIDGQIASFLMNKGSKDQVIKEEKEEEKEDKDRND